MSPSPATAAHRWRRTAALALAAAIASMAGATTSAAQPPPTPDDRAVIDPSWDLNALAAAAASAAAQSQERLMVLVNDAPPATVLESPLVSHASLAVDFAINQLGKPYAWGGAGPDEFDCSGLTLKAWNAAGVHIPRTSQQQWHDLPHIKKSDIRPGDLVIYYPDASHVGIYVGHGQIVQAPRPGLVIKRSSIDSMPVLGVVRPL